MATETPALPYVLGSTTAEHERLIRQAALFNPITERFLSDAGIGQGQRVLDIGSGLGDVSVLVAKLVSPSGTVVGVDNDTAIIAKAITRIKAAGISNVSFLECDIGRIESKEPFDAVVGRLILEFQPNAGEVVRSLVRLLRPGGIMAIQDAWWGPFLQLSSRLPLRSKCASLIFQSFERSRANMDMEFVLFRTFQEAGLAAPNMRFDTPVGTHPVFGRWVYDLFCSLLPRMQQYKLSYEDAGDVATLMQRLEAEAAIAKAFGATIGLVGAWSRKP